MPDDLRPQEEWLQENIPLFGPASVSSENTEADDLIATYARAASGEGVEVIIATNDKDILQLTCDKIRIYSTTKPEAGPEGFCLLGTPEVQAKWGVSPTQIADVLALTGDSSDNIPGVPGVGAKTAVALISAHGSIENLLADPGAIANPKLREKIAAARELIIANREMVRLDEDLPLPLPWSAFQIRPKYPELIQALRTCEFKGLLQEVEAEAARAAGPAGQQELF
jgi:DNA polymerase-1